MSAETDKLVRGLHPGKMPWFVNMGIPYRQSLKMLTLEGEEAFHLVTDRRFTAERSRLVISAASESLFIISKLISLVGDRFRVTYVREHQEGEVEQGRYLLRHSFEYREAIEFLYTHQEFLLCDGRHHLWIMNETQKSGIVYDQHDLIYYYGPQLRAIAFLLYREFLPTRSLSHSNFPHGHGFRSTFDEEEAEIVSQPGTYWSPLVEDIDTYRTDDLRSSPGDAENG